MQNRHQSFLFNNSLQIYAVALRLEELASDQMSNYMSSSSLSLSYFLPWIMMRLVKKNIHSGCLFTLICDHGQQEKGKSPGDSYKLHQVDLRKWVQDGLSYI